MYEHNALGYCSGLALCLTKVRSSRARCPATALIVINIVLYLFIVCWGFFIASSINLYVSLKNITGC